MKIENAIRVALILSGQFDTNETFEISGTDHYGQPMTEEVKGVDHEKLDAEVSRLMAIGRDEQKRCYERLTASYIERLNKKRT